MLFTDTAPQLHFLTDAAHLLATTAPQTSAFLMSRRNELLVENDIAVPDSQRQRVCSCCGHVMVPGQSSTLKIETKKTPRPRTNSKQQQQIRAMPGGISKVMTCGHCGRDSRLKLEGPSRISRHKKALQPQFTVAQAKQTQLSEPARPSANASSKKRAKHRKAGLQALLDQKQGSTVSSSSGFGLSLSDFMKK